MRSFPARATVFVGGVLLCSWCYLLVADTRLGSSPLFVFEEGISTVTGVPFGVVTIATGVFFVSLAMALSAPVGPGTLVVPALFGFGVSVMGPLVPHLSGTAIRVGAFLIATHLMMLGAALIVCASYGAAATDAVMMGIARMSRRSHARVRTAMEITFTLLGVSLGGRAGLGTAVAAVTVGHSFDLWARILPAPAQKHPAKVSPRRRRAPREGGERRRVRPSLSLQQSRLRLGQVRPSRPHDPLPRSIDALSNPHEPDPVAGRFSAARSALRGRLQ